MPAMILVSSPSASGLKAYPKSLSVHVRIPVICAVWAGKSRVQPHTGWRSRRSSFLASSPSMLDVRYSIFYSLLPFSQALFISYVQLESTAAGLPAAILNIGPAHLWWTVGEFTGALHSYSWYLRQDRYVSPSGRFVMPVACEPPFLCAPARWPIMTNSLE